MPNYNGVVLRENVPVPETTVKEVIQAAPAQSLALSLMKQATMSTKTSRQPVLSALPQAYWVNGDTGRKQTTTAAWKNVVLVAEELATLVPIPNALVDDTDIPLWDEIKPLLVEAVGVSLDLATVWGVDKPASWTSPSLVPGAIAAGNVVTAGSGADKAADIAKLGGVVAGDGYQVTAFASDAGYDWQLAGLRTANGTPLFVPSGAIGLPGSLYSRPLVDVRNGTFDSDVAELIAADFSKFIVSVRQDMTQEALTNVLKHAGPDARASVTLTYAPREIIVDVLDNGSPDGEEPAEAGHGLRGMTERVTSMGGRMVARPRPSGGFQVTVVLPLTR